MATVTGAVGSVTFNWLGASSQNGATGIYLMPFASTCAIACVVSDCRPMTVTATFCATVEGRGNRGGVGSGVHIPHRVLTTAGT